MKKASENPYLPLTRGGLDQWHAAMYEILDRLEDHIEAAHVLGPDEHGRVRKAAAEIHSAMEHLGALPWSAGLRRPIPA